MLSVGRFNIKPRALGGCSDESPSVNRMILRDMGWRSMASSAIARYKQTSTPFTADVNLERLTADKISSICYATDTALLPVQLPTSHHLHHPRGLGCPVHSCSSSLLS